MSPDLSQIKARGLPTWWPDRARGRLSTDMGGNTVSISLDRMASDCARRLAAHDMMLRHLGLDPGPEDAPRVIAELRGTLRACAACQTPGRCAEWCRDGWPGPPRFCQGEAAFADLARALTVPGRVRVA